MSSHCEGIDEPASPCRRDAVAAFMPLDYSKHEASPGFGLGQASLGSGVRENRGKKKEESEGGWTDGESVMMPKRR